VKLVHLFGFIVKKLNLIRFHFCFCSKYFLSSET